MCPPSIGYKVDIADVGWESTAVATVAASADLVFAGLEAAQMASAWLSQHLHSTSR